MLGAPISAATVDLVGALALYGIVLVLLHWWWTGRCR